MVQAVQHCGLEEWLGPSLLYVGYGTYRILFHHNIEQ